MDEVYVIMSCSNMRFKYLFKPKRQVIEVYSHLLPNIMIV